MKDAVLVSAPYWDRPGRDTANDTDMILPVGGAPAIVDVVALDGCYRAVICLILPADSLGASTWAAR